MYLIVEDNPNCPAEERVFAEQKNAQGPRVVKRVHVDGPDGAPAWFQIASVEEGPRFGRATAVLVDDSGAGVAWLISGGSWGVRLKSDAGPAWSLDDKSQWGRPFLVLDHGGKEIDFE